MRHPERRILTLVVATMAAVAVGSDLAAQETGASVLSSAEIRALVVERSNASVERRSALSAFLEKSEVKRVARSVGIDIRRVESAVATLSDAEIERLEPSLLAADEALVGGAAVTVATTTLLIAALIFIIILMA